MEDAASPRVTFGIIVLNGEPFTRYNLRALYPFAHEIIVVEGASPAAAASATSDGHSSDGTLDALRGFKANEDPENKLVIVTAEDDGHPNGFWPGEKDEQSRAYARRATGEYLWQVDIDEFYHAEDMRRVLALLRRDPSISGVAFEWINFWGGFGYVADGWEYRRVIRRLGGNRRVMRWGTGYVYATHRPPTVLDEKGRDVFRLNWISYRVMARLGIYCYHYGMVFPSQARQKTAYYLSAFESHRTMQKWYDSTYLHLRRPFHVLHGLPSVSWLERFRGEHPVQAELLQRDIDSGSMRIDLRQTGDIEAILASRTYMLEIRILRLLSFLRRGLVGWVGIVLKALRRLVHVPMRALRRIFCSRTRMWGAAPCLLQNYERLLADPRTERRPGGWMYQGKFYPDYLMMGGASHAVSKTALKYCRGSGIDVGAGYWPLDGAIPVDLEHGPGAGRTLSEFQDGSLDYVFSSHCLEHIEGWQSELRKWVGKLKHGGGVFLYLPHPDCTIWHPGSPFVGNGHKWIPSPTVVADALRGVGCEVEAREDGPDAMRSFWVWARRTG